MHDPETRHLPKRCSFCSTASLGINGGTMGTATRVEGHSKQRKSQKNSQTPCQLPACTQREGGRKIRGESKREGEGEHSEHSSLLLWQLVDNRCGQKIHLDVYFSCSHSHTHTGAHAHIHTHCHHLLEAHSIHPGKVHHNLSLQMRADRYTNSSETLFMIVTLVIAFTKYFS